MRVRIILGLCLLIVVAALATGCGESATSPGTGLEVNNAVDTFQYQVTNVRKYTHETTYAWQTTGAVASVNQATTVTRGSVTLVLLDANRTQVYSRSLAENGTYSSSSGVPGTWTIRLTYSDANATVNFRVQKAP